MRWMARGLPIIGFVAGTLAVTLVSAAPPDDYDPRATPYVMENAGGIKPQGVSPLFRPVPAAPVSPNAAVPQGTTAYPSYPALPGGAGFAAPVQPVYPQAVYPSQPTYPSPPVYQPQPAYPQPAYPQPAYPSGSIYPSAPVGPTPAYRAPYGMVPPPPPPPGQVGTPGLYAQPAPGAVYPQGGLIAPGASVYGPSRIPVRPGQAIPRPPPPPGVIARPVSPSTAVLPRPGPPRITQPASVPTPRPQTAAPFVRSQSTMRLILEGSYSLREDAKGPVGQSLNATDELRWDPLSFDGAFGGRGALQFGGRTDTRWEIKGAYWGEWDEQRSTAGRFGYNATAGAPLTTTGPHTADLRIQSRLLGGEINWRPLLQCSPTSRLDAIVGIRVMLLEEQATVTNIAPGINPTIGAGFMQADVENLILAGQAGIGYEANVTSGLSLFTDLRAFFGANLADATTKANTVFAAGESRNTRSGTTFAWGAQVDLGLRLQISSGFAFQAGYSLLFVDGVGEIESAMDFSDVSSGGPRARLTDDGLLFHTFFAGITLDL